MRHVPLPYLYLNRDGFVLFANKYATHLIGYSLIEVVQQSIDNLVVHTLTDRLMTLTNWLGSQPLGISVSVRHKDGHVLSARIKIMMDTLPNATVQGFHVFIFQTVIEQNTEAVQTDLEKSYLQLQTHLKARTDFMHNFLHELKTPLSTLNTSLYLLERASETIKVRHINILFQQIAHLKDMVHTATEYLHCGQFDNTLNSQVLLMNKIVTEAAELYQYRFEAKKIQMRVKLPARDCHIMGDRTRLLQVFINLFENAYRYTEHGRITVAISADYEKSLVFVILQDTGIGIPLSELPYVFERFYRAENAKELMHNGTGLGLAITKQIVEQHNGEIEIYSRQNVGTSVVITLPLVI